MKRSKKKYPICSCCKSEVHRTEMNTCLSVLEKIERAEYKHYKELKIDTYDSFIECSFEWACDNCLKDKKAILASPGSQNYSWYPNLAYHDIDKTCRNCGTDFKFTKEEKQLWYEKLKFWTDSEPVNCLSCRREVRLLKIDNTTLSTILKKAETEMTQEELQTVVEIYRKWEKEERAKYYESILTKRLKRSS